MSETLQVFGKTYSGVTSIKAIDNNDNIQTFIKPEGSLPIS